MGSITETEHRVVVASGDGTWTFQKVIVASGDWSRRLMPDHLTAVTETKRIVLSWFIAQDGTQFSPEKFPVFSGCTTIAPCTAHPPSTA